MDVRERGKRGFSDDEVQDFVAGLDDEVARRSPLWAMYSRAYRTEFWTGANRWSVLPGMEKAGTTDDPFPVKVEANQVWPFVQSHVSNLYFRAPRCELEFPAVSAVTTGRYLDDVTAVRRVTVFDDEWIKRSDIQELSTYGLQLSLFHGVSAYKLGLKPNPKGVMDRVWVDVVPFWELLWDDRARSWEQQAYRGHIRYERVDRAEEIVGAEIEDTELEVLPDVLEWENAGEPYRTRETHAKKYVRVLEFYDLLANEQRFYLVSGRQGGCTLKPIGKVLPIPWELPSGRPGVPILPIVLSNEPEFPLKGVSSVARVYQMNSETNLLLTIVANMMRRDSARISLAKAGLGKAFEQAVRDAIDGTVVFVPDNINLAEVKNALHTIDWGRASETLDKYRAMLAEGRQDSQGISDLMQGKQGKYLSATEADILAGSGETAALEIGTRMAESMARALELVNVMIAGTMKKREKFSVRTEKGREKISRAELELPWTVGIVDSGTTPVRLQKRKAELQAVQKPYLEMVKIASSPEPDPAAPAPVDPATVVSPELRTAARLMLDYTVQLYQLPESLTWTALSARSADGAAKPLDPEETAEAQALMDRAVGLEDEPVPGPAIPQGPQGA